MNYKRVLNKLWGDLTSYRETIDGFVKSYEKDSMKFEKEVDEIRASGDYSQGFIERYISAGDPALKYRNSIETARNKVAGSVNGSLEDLRLEIEGYFTAPVRPEFANKVSSAKMVGLQFSDFDFETMLAECSGHLELAMIHKLAEDRKETKAVYAKNSGVPQKQEVSNPYVINTPIPDRASVLSDFKQFEYATNLLLKKYSGINLELKNALGYPIGTDWSSDLEFANSDAILRPHGLFEDMHKTMESIEKAAPTYAKSVSGITPSEKERLDTVFDPSKAETRSKTEVLEFANKSSFGSIMKRDPRYAHFFEPEPTYLA